jgi:hypothetical protein
MSADGLARESQIGGGNAAICHKSSSFLAMLTQIAVSISTPDFSDLVEIVMARHHLSGCQRSGGQRNSALVRAAQKQAFLWEVRRHLIELARSGTLGSTLRERAQQLNQRGVRTARGNLIDEKKLSAAMKQLGVDSSRIKSLIYKAEYYADSTGVNEDDIFDQLWHEWLYHHTRILVDHGVIFYDDSDDKYAFIFKPIPPLDWQNNHPMLRDERVMRWWIRGTKVIPPQAQLVYALFGMFGFRKFSANRKRTAWRVSFP